MKYLAVIATLACLVFADVKLTVSVDPDEVMTKQEKAEFGADKWTPKQKADFKKFLQRYALNVANVYTKALNGDGEFQ